jgi:hypothetical protein
VPWRRVVAATVDVELGMFLLIVAGIVMLVSVVALVLLVTKLAWPR